MPKTKSLLVHHITIVPTTSPADALVLALAPPVLKSYLYWRLEQENRQGTIDCRLFNYNEGADPEQMAQTVLAEPVAVVALSAYVWNASELIRTAQIIKNVRPEIQVIMGGPEASPQAEALLLEHACLDAIPYDEKKGELVYFHLLDRLSRGQPLSQAPGLWYRDHSGQLQQSAPVTDTADLTQMPSPFLDGTIQFTPGQRYNVTLETARGCPFDCAYCYWGKDLLRKMMFYPQDRVLAEIDMVFSNPNITSVNFADADFLMKPARSLAILQRIEEHLALRDQPPAITFELNAASFKESAREAIQIMARLPGHFFTFAVQSVNENALRHLGKHRAGKDLYQKRAAWLRECAPDALLYVDIMFPLPGDDFAGYLDTVEFSLSLNPDKISINYPVYLLPGTDFFNRKDELDLVYTKQAPLAIVETTTFPRSDVQAAYQLAIWVELFTKYYHLLGLALQQYHEAVPERRRVDLLLSWIKDFEQELHLMDRCVQLLDVLLESLTERNRLKGAILRKACEARAARVLYRIVADRCRGYIPSNTIQLLDAAAQLFDTLHHHNVDTLNPSALQDFLSGNPKCSELATQGVVPTFFRAAEAVPYQDAVYLRTQGITSPIPDNVIN